MAAVTGAESLSNDWSDQEGSRESRYRDQTRHHKDPHAQEVGCLESVMVLHLGVVAVMHVVQCYQILTYDAC